MKLGTLMAQALREADVHHVSHSSLRLLMSETLQLGLAELHLHSDMELQDSVLQLWDARLRRLLNGEPPQYISGRAWFWGLPLRIGPGILIPRPETEGLVELAINRSAQGARLLDCCTGSGAIAIALKKLRSDLEICGTAISSAAISIANLNAADLDLDIKFFECDLFPTGIEPLDLIVSNPPYVSQPDYDTLDQEVRIHEPRVALLSGNEGLDHITRILASAMAYLKPGGLLCLEHGDTQRERIVSLARQLDWPLEYAGDDLAGKPRYLVFRRPDENKQTAELNKAALSEE